MKIQDSVFVALDVIRVLIFVICYLLPNSIFKRSKAFSIFDQSRRIITL